MTQSSHSRFEELDVVRGLAALGVVIYHFIWRYPAAFPDIGDWLPRGDLDAESEKYIGKAPVFIFFMISGFVIFWTVERSKTGADFVFSRVSRLYPAYWAAVVMTASLSALALPRDPIAPLPLGDVVANLLMFHDFFGINHVDGVYWSLSVELCFYLLVLCAKLAGWLPHYRRVLAGWLVLTLAYGFLDPARNPIPWPAVRFLVLDYAGFFILGMIAYRYWRGNALGRADWVLIGGAIFNIFQRNTLGFSLILTMFVAIFFLIAGRHMSWIVSAPLRWLGACSYPLYLVHQNIGYIVMEALSLPHAAQRHHGLLRDHQDQSVGRRRFTGLRIVR